MARQLVFEREGRIYLTAHTQTVQSRDPARNDCIIDIGYEGLHLKAHETSGWSHCARSGERRATIRVEHLMRPPASEGRGRTERGLHFIASSGVPTTKSRTSCAARLMRIRSGNAGSLEPGPGRLSGDRPDQARRRRVLRADRVTRASARLGSSSLHSTLPEGARRAPILPEYSPCSLPGVDRALCRAAA